jgi:UDP-glucuronate 4-epimerase
VVHPAAQAGVRYSLQNPHAYLDANLAGFLNVLEGCRHRKTDHQSDDAKAAVRKIAAMVLNASFAIGIGL